MPRDGSNVYSKASASFVPLQVASSAAVNADFDDLVTDANTPRAIVMGGTGQSTPLGAHDAFVAAGNVVASAATLAIDAVVGPLIDISGVAAVTAVTLSAGKLRIARATGIFTLTASASLVVNTSTAVNYTTKVGDLLIFEGYAAGVVGVWAMGAGSGAVSDSLFRVQDNGDATKQLAFEVSGLTTGTTRTLTPTDKNGTMILAADAAPGLGMVNGTLVASVNASALTIAIKTLAGNDPSASDPVIVAFRDATSATGDYIVRTLIAATSIVVPSTATLGASNGVAFRIWIVGFDDVGTFRLGVVNALSGTSIMALRDDLLASSTLTPASAAQVIYTTGAAVAAKAMRLLGYAEYSAGLAAVGTWNIVPTKLQLFGPGVAKPGDVIQVQRLEDGAGANGTTLVPFDDTIPQNTEGTQFMTLSITPTAAANLLRVSHVGMYSESAANGVMTLALFRDAGANAIAAIACLPASSATTAFSGILNKVLLAGSTASTAFKIRAGAASASTTQFNGQATVGRDYGGVANSSIQVEELMA